MVAAHFKNPVYSCSCLPYTQMGYVGSSVGNSLNPLQLRAKTKNKRPLSIAFIDEIEKSREASGRWGIVLAHGLLLY